MTFLEKLVGLFNSNNTIIQEESSPSATANVTKTEENASVFTRNADGTKGVNTGYNGTFSLTVTGDDYSNCGFLNPSVSAIPV